MRMTRIALAPLAATLLLGGTAAAQEADPQAQVEEVQQRYEEAIAAGDWQAVASLYAEDALYASLFGDLVEGREGIAGFYEQSGVKALDLRSSRAEMIGERVILDIGTFTATLSGEEGETEIEGEYVSLGEVGEEGFQIRSANIFPMRRPPEAPAQ